MILLYTLQVRPFKFEVLNRMEIFNEGIILTLSYMVWGFSDYQDSPEGKFETGWVYCLIIIICIIFNILIMIYLSVWVPLKRCLKNKR